MTQMNLFESKPDQLPMLDENTDFLSELVGEGKKFKDEKALARGKYEADMYVKTLETKLDEMRRDYEEARKQNMAGARLEELIDRMNKSSSQSEDDRTQKSDEENTTPQFKPEDIEKMVKQKIEEAKRSDKEMLNYSQVQAKLKERFGVNYLNVLEQQKQALGLDDALINTLAKTAPAAFFKTLGLDQPSQDGFQAPPQSQIRNNQFQPNVPKRTWSYYQGIKKKDRAEYYAPKTIAQMHRDHAELGREFEDGDYHA